MGNFKWVQFKFFFFNIWMPKQTLFSSLIFPLVRPKQTINLLIYFILTFVTLIWQSIIFQTEVSNALFTERPLPWQMSP